jgi:hypothetical protein
VDRLVVICPDQRLGHAGPQLVIDGVELLGPVHRDDGDTAVRLVLHEIVGHASSPACPPATNSASTTVRPPYAGINLIEPFPDVIRGKVAMFSPSR